MRRILLKITPYKVICYSIQVINIFYKVHRQLDNMPSTYCCVPMCTNVGGHRFPKDITLKQKWIMSIKRDKWQPSPSSLVCSLHFKSTDYLGESLRFGTASLTRRLKTGAVPSTFPWIEADSEAVVLRRKRAIDRKERISSQNLNIKKRRVIEQSNQDVPLGTMHDLGEFDVGQEVEIESSSAVVSQMVDQFTQTEYNKRKDEGIQTDIHCTFSVMTYRHDNAGIHFYTGLETYEKFHFVFQTLGEASSCLKYYYGNPPSNISPYEQFFLTLIILRTHKTFFEISRMYLITIKDVTNIFITWIKFMSLHWKELDLWTCKNMIKFYSPMIFYEHFPSTRLILDGTECPMKKPALPTAQQATFSTYKNRNTLKVLVGATPSGLINFVSLSYAGSASDRQIVERSNLTSLCDPGDSIMADKGLNVQDIFAAYGVKINIPTFFKKSNQIQENTLKNDRKIASKRVHIERVIGLIKTYKILKSPMNYTETVLSHDIIFICCMLANFRSRIIGSDA